EIGVLGQKSVAGMNRFCVGHLRGTDDRGDIQVALTGRRRPDAHRLVRQPYVLGVRVGFRMHGNGLDAQLAARALDPQGDLASVGYENFFEHLGALVDQEGTNTHDMQKGRVRAGILEGVHHLRVLSGSRNHATRNSGSPYSTGWPFSTYTSLMTPPWSASISL